MLEPKYHAETYLTDTYENFLCRIYSISPKSLCITTKICFIQYFAIILYSGKKTPCWIWNWVCLLSLRSEIAQLCVTLCDLMDCSLPVSSVYAILQARVLEWVVISFSRGSSWSGDWTQFSRITGKCFTLWATRKALVLLLLSRFSHVQLCATP